MEEALEEKIVRLLTEKSMTVTTVESCTGGLVAGTIINASGASACFNEGYITYSNEAKHKLVNVNNDTLDKFGAVSKETAIEMAEGGAKAACSDAAVSVTGVAGPQGGTKEKPVGLVYIGCYVNNNTVVEKHEFNGDRASVRKQTVECALRLLYKCLND